MKHKVMLVDDYVPTLRHLEAMVDWDALNLQVVAKAHSSVNALSQFAKWRPDILVTDIGMPQMDGIELAARCREMKPELRVIFITCHEEFHYAKKAFQLNAHNYLIKDELTPEQLADTLAQAAMFMELQRLRNAQSDYREDLLRNRDVLKHSFLRQLLAGTGPLHDTIGFGRRLGVVWEYSDFALVAAGLDYASFADRYALRDLPLIQYGIYNIAQELARQTERECPWIRMTPFLLDGEAAKDNGFMMLTVVNFEKKLEYSPMEAVGRALRDLRVKIADYLKVNVRLSVSRPFRDLRHLRMVHDEMKQSRLAQFYEDADIHFMQEGTLRKWREADTSLLAEVTDRIHISLHRKQYESLHGLFRSALRAAKEASLSPERWIDCCTHWMRLIDAETAANFGEDFYHYLRNAQKASEAMDLIGKRLKAVAASAAESRLTFTKEPKLDVIDQYIYENLSENITTVSMAQKLYLNPSYFSRYFKKLTGENFIDHVHRLKMDLAKKLLQNRYETIETIALKLGYNDRTYFSRVFKKYVGFSPSEYREMR